MERPTEPAGISEARRWATVAAAFVSTFTVFGVAYSFGAFFDSMADEFGTGRGLTALMFSVTTALYFGGGVVSGRFADRYGPRPVMVVGTVSLGLGLLATSAVGSIWLGYITYGLGVGTAVACGYVPMVAMVGGWFERRRTTALGIAVAGIGAGTLVCAPLAAHLIEAHGWRRAYVIFAIGGVASMALATLGVRRAPSRGAGGRVDLRAVARQRPFVVLYLGSLALSLALFVPFVFIKSYATERGVEAGRAALLVGLIGASSIIGRLGLGALGARLGAIRLLQGSFVTMAGSYLIWMASDGRYGLLVLYTVVMGIGYGGFIALSPAVVAELFGTDGMATILGATYTAAGIGGLVGPPTAGAIIDRWGFGIGIGFALVMTLVAAVTLLALPRGR
ncbi:MAG: MFS transporter [Ilumatobacter sp.]